MKSGFVLPKNFANQNDEDDCVVTEDFNSELGEDIITVEDGVITCAAYTLQLSVHDFF